VRAEAVVRDPLPRPAQSRGATVAAPAALPAAGDDERARPIAQRERPPVPPSPAAAPRPAVARATAAPGPLVVTPGPEPAASAPSAPAGERHEAPAAAESHRPAPSPAEPVHPVAVPRPRAPGEPVPPAAGPRPVHVRIGTVEVHAASPPQEPDAAPPAAVAPPVEPAGFEDFSGVRAYAPWDR
jgi:hypothetical protein